MSRSQQALAIAANIALARQVYDIPEDPITHDPIANFQNRLPPPELYHLPAQKEVELAHALAVTSKLKDESDYTSAVTVTEDPKRRRLLVLLAVNRASPEDGQEELDGAHAALERVLEIMSEVRSRNNDGMQDRILGAVVTACHAKILARMGLAPCRHNKTRMPLDGKLSQAVQAVNNLLWQKQPPGAQEFRHFGTIVLQLIAKWRQAPDDIDRLVAVVYGLHELHENVPTLDRLMRELPPRSIVPSAAKSIAAVVAKTAYYVRVARTLYRTAKKYPIARRARIVPINLPPIAFAQTPLPMHGTPGAAAVLSRDTKIKSLCSGAPPATLQTIVRYLNSSAKASRAGESFEEVMHTSLTGRIHAEMQIIYYCNMPENSHILSPRAVCASKASCFLCNSYVTAHSSVYVPFSHGRLYTNWRLPNMSGLEIPEAAFVGRLETTVTWGLGLLSAYGHAPQRPEPAQSVVMGLTSSTTTIGDLGSYDAEREDAEVWYTEDEMENYVDEITEHGDDDDELELETEPHLIREHDDDDDEQNNLMDEDEDEEVQDSGPYQNGVSVNGTNPYGSNPLGTNPMGTNPMGTNPMGTNPFGTNPMGSAPHGAAFTAPVIVSSHRELANETADVETAPTTPEPEPELQQVEALAAAKREAVASSESDPLSLPERPKQHFIRAQSAPVSSSSASRPEPPAASVTEAVVEEQVVEAETDEAIDTDAGSDLAVSEMSERPSAPDLRTQSVSEPSKNTHRPAVPTPPTHAATPFVFAEHERRESGAYTASYQSTAVSDGSVSDGDIEPRDKPPQMLRSSASTRPVVVNSTVESVPSPIVEPVVQVVEVANTAKVAESVATSAAEPDPQPAVVAEPVTVPVPVVVDELATQSPEIPAKAAARELKEEPDAAESLVPTVVKDVQPVARPDAEPKPEPKTTVEPPAAPVVVAAPAELAVPGAVSVADFAIPAPVTAVAPAPAAVEIGVSPKAEVSETAEPTAEPATSASAQTTVPDQAPVSAPTPAAPISAETVAPVAVVNQTPAPAQAGKDTTANIASAPVSIASGPSSETRLKKGLRYRLKSLFKKGNKTAAAAAK